MFQTYTYGQVRVPWNRNRLAARLLHHTLQCEVKIKVENFNACARAIDEKKLYKVNQG